jgi:hypothetical protein
MESSVCYHQAVAVFLQRLRYGRVSSTWRALAAASGRKSAPDLS